MFKGDFVSSNGMHELSGGKKLPNHIPKFTFVPTGFVEESRQTPF